MDLFSRISDRVWNSRDSLELDPRTFERLRSLPLAEELVIHGRQELVKRLDTYELEHTGLLSQIVELVSSKFMPIITRHALSGRAHVNSENPIFNEPLAIPMLIDVFSERGYHAAVDKQIQGPRSASTWSRGEIKSGVKAVYRIEVHFETSKIRRGGGPTPGPTPLFDAVVCLLAPPALLCSRERRYHRLP